MCRTPQQGVFLWDNLFWDNRAEWVEDQECRRTYYAVYIPFGILALSCNHMPAISFNGLEDLLLPSTEALRNLQAADELAWEEGLTAPTQGDVHGVPRRAVPG